jgi:hypothetical protein
MTMQPHSAFEAMRNRRQTMLICGGRVLASTLLLTLCLVGCGNSGELDDDAQARLAAEQEAVDQLKQQVGDEKFEQLQSDGDEDGKGLPPHAVFSKLEQAKRARGGRNRPR